MAVLLVNNGDKPRDLSFVFEQVPGLVGTASSGYCIYDVWAGAVVQSTMFDGGYTRKAVAPHDSVFLKLAAGCSQCT